MSKIKPDSGGLDMDVLTAPLGDLISSVGLGVAEAQRALDAQAIETTLALQKATGGVLGALKAVGYQPTWYTIPEVDAEIIVSLSVQPSETESGVEGRRAMTLSATPVDASFVNSYDYNLQAVSKLKFKIRPVPPPEGATALEAGTDEAGSASRGRPAALPGIGSAESPFDVNTSSESDPEPGSGGL